MMRLEGKVCIVTGSAKGIGRATAEKFLNEGAKVLVCDVDDDAIDLCISSFETFGNAALGCHVDVTNRDSVAKMVELARIKFG
ncbi:MAG: SDR family NAD(P)-dependent oxidoreductase, partial [Betaproteobacteria bacterium]